MSEHDLQKTLKKACSIEETAPKRKHVRACIVYTWDNKSARAIFQTLKSQAFVNDEVQLFKMLFVIHKVIQEGHPSALKEAIKEKHWIKSLERVHPQNSSYSKLIKEYVKYLVRKLNFHAHHKGFNNGTFEYEEYVSLVSVADPDEGYETILDLMSLMDTIDEYSQFTFASIQSDSVNNECKIASLIPMVAESYGIYKFVTSMLRAMYRQLGEDDPALAPLKERYELQHGRLFEFYADCSSIKFLTSLVTIPKLPTTAPNVSKVVELDTNAKEIKFEKRQPSPERKQTTSPVKRTPTQTPQPSRNVSSTFISPVATSGTMAQMIPTVTAAVNMVPMMTGIPAQQQQQAEYWAQQQQQYANEQARLEQERQLQLQQQQQQQQMFQQQLQNAQQEMMAVQLQEKSQQQNDLMALNQQYEKDQVLLQQYDDRVQQLESEIKTMNDNATSQLVNKDDQLNSLQDQMNVWEKKYESLAKLYSQLRQEHLQLLPKFKKLQVKVNSAHEAIKQKEQLENKMKQKDLQMADLIKDRDRLRVENDRIDNNNANDSQQIEKDNLISEDKMALILDASLESGIATIQESIYNLDAQGSWIGPLTTANHIMTLIEGSSETATEFATSFNDLIVDGMIEGDQPSVILNISEFSIAISTMVTNIKAFSTTTLKQEESDGLVDLIERCAREAQYFFEDLMSDNLLAMEDEETRTDAVINANVDMQEKLQELSIVLEPYLNRIPTTSKESNGHSELVETAENIEKSSQILRVNVDVNVPKPILDLSLAIIDAIVALVKAAIDCQNEIATTTKIPLSQFYKKNSRWTEGLISAAKAVGTATKVLITTAGNLITDNGVNASPEEIIVASKEVAASTAQLVASSRVKTLPHSKAQNKLEDSSKNVSSACRQLVDHVMIGVEGNQEETPFEFTSEHAVKTAEMEQQVTILKLEQSLNNARKRLGEIRKHAYYLNDDDK
ncbi:protein Sla2p [Monosporozyma unispora]|nr:sla2 Src-like adaptor 2 [Kazachstania unispora]